MKLNYLRWMNGCEKIDNSGLPNSLMQIFIATATVSAFYRNRTCKHPTMFLHGFGTVLFKTVVSCREWSGRLNAVVDLLRSRAFDIIKDCSHSANCLFHLLNPGRRYRSLMSRIERLLNQDNLHKPHLPEALTGVYFYTLQSLMVTLHFTSFGCLHWYT